MHGEIAEEFSRHYSAREQALILKLLRAMLFANYCGNGYYRRPWKKGEAQQVCEVDYGISENN